MNTLKKSPAPKKSSKRGSEEKYTPAQMIAAIHEASGLLAGAAKILRCSRTTVYAYAEKYPEVKAAIQESSEATTDMVEDQLLKQIRSGNITAIIFYLKTKAKARGYVERTEHTGAEGEPLVPRVNLKDLDKDQFAAIKKARDVIESVGVH